MIISQLLYGLNDKQQEAVQCTQGPLLIRAGAGSGKTRVLTRRIAYLIQHDHVNPYNILALTFTNKAADEMKRRINSLLGTDYSGVWASNFHILGIRILHQYAPLIGYKKSFTVAGASTQDTIVKHIIVNRMGLSKKQYKPKEIHAIISGCKNELQTPNDYLHEHIHGHKLPLFSRVVYRAYLDYQHHLEVNQEMDFDDLLMRTVQLFKSHSEILHKLQSRFKYISVDEYQDTNHAQYEMIRLLASKYHNLCAVGDENQSIYGWRGADIRNIQDFKQDYPEAKVIYMEQNYRSTKSILDVADSVIKHNYKSLPEDEQPWTDNQQGDLVTSARLVDSNDEARYVIKTILKLRDLYHYNWDDFAILYRTNAQSREFEQDLIDSHIPYQIIGGHKFLDRKEIQDILAYLTLIINPSDNISFNRIINVPHRGLGEKSVIKLQNYAYQHNLSNLTVAFKADEVPKLSTRAKNQFKSFAYKIGKLSRTRRDMSVTKVVTTVLHEMNIVDTLKQKFSKAVDNTARQKDTAEERYKNLSQFVNLTKEYDIENQMIPKRRRLSRFLNHIQLESAQDKISNRDSVKLMTIHAAKGLEYPVIFVVGMENGIFPGNPDAGIAQMHEERRVCYVAMTRAERHLYLTHVLFRRHFGRMKSNPPSKFLKEVNHKYLHQYTDVPFWMYRKARIMQMQNHWYQTKD